MTDITLKMIEAKLRQLLSDLRCHPSHTWETSKVMKYVDTDEAVLKYWITYIGAIPRPFDGKSSARWHVILTNANNLHKHLMETK